MILRTMDSSFPKFKEDPQTRNDYISNLQLVQQYFERRNIKLYFPVDKMVNLKMQDNLEVVQWFYRYWDREATAQENGTGAGYAGDCHYDQDQFRRGARMLVNGSAGQESFTPGSSSVRVSAPQTLISTVAHLDDREIGALKKEIEEMKCIVHQKQLQIEKMQGYARIFQNERDFYFNKLTMIEKLLKDDSYELTNGTKREILRMMYEN